MLITKKKNETVDWVVDALCNKCGESCIPKDSYSKDPTGTFVKFDPNTKYYIQISMEEAELENKPDLYGLIETKVYGGYCSKKLTDMTEYTFSLCEACLKEMFDTFKIPVQTKEV